MTDDDLTAEDVIAFRDDLAMLSAEKFDLVLAFANACLFTEAEHDQRALARRLMAAHLGLIVLTVPLDKIENAIATAVADLRVAVTTGDPCVGWATAPGIQLVRLLTKAETKL